MKFNPEKVKIARELKGWTQQELAGKLGGKTTQQIQQLEEGRHAPSMKTLEELIAVFDASLGFFFDKEGK